MSSFSRSIPIRNLAHFAEAHSFECPVSHAGGEQHSLCSSAFLRETQSMSHHRACNPASPLFFEHAHIIESGTEFKLGFMQEHAACPHRTVPRRQRDKVE